MPDEHARLLHLLEQAEGVLADITPSLAGYYARLVDAGIPAPQAIVLVRDVQRRYLGSVSSDD
jgi:hypothetical protein